MSATVTLYYDFFSPYTYLAWSQLPGLRQQIAAAIEYVPIDLLKLMQQVNNTPTTLQCKAKNRYAQQDLGRWAQHYQLKLSPNPHMKEIARSPLRQAAIVAKQRGEIEAFNQAVFPEVWAGGANLGEASTLKSVLEAADLADAEGLLRAARGAEADQQLEANNNQSVEAGVFGSPTFVLGKQLFFGNDRLHFLEQSLNAQ